MTRDELDEAFGIVIRRHWRQLTDSGGQPGALLLGELAGVAERHADEILHEEVGVTGHPAGGVRKLSRIVSADEIQAKADQLGVTAGQLTGEQPVKPSPKPRTRRRTS